MKKIKKISSLLLICFLGFIFICYPATVFAADNSFSNYAATYKTTGVLAERYLGYGVNFKKESATLSVTSSSYASGQAYGNEVKYTVEANKEYTNEVSVLNIDLSKGARLVPYAVVSGSDWKAASLRVAALDYEVKHPGSKVIAGVNGDYFQISQSVMASTGVTIGDGQYYKSLSNHGSVNTLGFKNDGVGKQIISTTVNNGTPVLTIFNESGSVVKKITIDKVNPEKDYTLNANEVVLYYTNKTAAFANTFKPGNIYKDAWLVDKAQYAVTTLEGSFYGVGTITNYVDANQEITKGQFAIKTNNSEINDLLSENVKIQVQYEYLDPSLEGINNFIGFPFTILENGTPMPHDVYRHPRTMIGQKENGEIVLAVIDGRQEKSGLYGASSLEMAAIMGYYGCVDAWNLDGGGSSTMIVRKSTGWGFEGYNEASGYLYHVTNKPSDKNERNDGNHLLVVVDVPEVTVDYTEITDTTVTLNVALISEIEKYKEIYVYINNEYVKVEDSKAVITGLTANKEYNYEIYAKIDGSMNSLLTVGNFNTNKEKPSFVEVSVAIFSRGDTKQIRVKYSYNGKEAVKSVVLILDEERYVSAGASLLFDADDFEFFFDNIAKGTVEIKYNINHLYDDQKILFEDFKLIFEVPYIMEEIKYETNSMFEDIFQ